MTQCSRRAGLRAFIAGFVVALSAWCVASPVSACTADKFSQSYIEFRRENAIAFRKGYGAAKPYTSDQKFRVLLLSRLHPFEPSRDAFDCALQSGDQLALYLSALSAFADGNSTSEIAIGFKSLVEAAKPKSVPSASECRYIDDGKYECANGLPEAHLLLAKIFANCSSPLKNRALALFHADAAMRAWVPYADAAKVAALEQSYDCNRNQDQPFKVR